MFQNSNFKIWFFFAWYALLIWAVRNIRTVYHSLFKTIGRMTEKEDAAQVSGRQADRHRAGAGLVQVSATRVFIEVC